MTVDVVTGEIVNEIDVVLPSEAKQLEPGRQMTLFEEIDSRQDKLQPFLTGSRLSAHKLCHAFKMELYKNPKLKNCALPSLMQALTYCAELQLEPGFGSVYLIPYGGQCKAQIGIQGWLTLLWRGESVKNITYNVVREDDDFEYEIEHTGTRLHHKPKLGSPSEIIGAYAMVNLASGHIQFKYCDRKEIEESRAASPSANKADSIWDKHFDRMAQIVPLRKLARTIAPSLLDYSEGENPIIEATTH